MILKETSLVTFGTARTVTRCHEKRLEGVDDVSPAQTVPHANQTANLGDLRGQTTHELPGPPEQNWGRGTQNHGPPSRQDRQLTPITTVQRKRK